MDTDTEEIPGTDNSAPRRKFHVQAVVLPRSPSYMSFSDLLKMREVEALTSLVERVHRDGYMGETWPRQHTVGLVREFGGWRGMSQDEIDTGKVQPDEYHVRAWVMAVPR